MANQNTQQTAASTTIIESLELVAENAGDISPAILQRYFAKCPASAKLMDHMDRYMLGRMLDQVLLLVMEDDDNELQNYLRFETSSHSSYGVEQYMYEHLFEAVLETVTDAAGSAWTQPFQQAWQARISSLLQSIREADAALA
jgi:hemoglobin-like flavoprotein